MLDMPIRDLAGQGPRRSHRISDGIDKHVLPLKDITKLGHLNIVIQNVGWNMDQIEAASARAEGLEQLPPEVGVGKLQAVRKTAPPRLDMVGVVTDNS
jgi:hypothetical protein